MQAIELSESQQDFARCIGYEVALKDGGTGINLGLFFPDTWAADGIIKPNGVNVFFPDQNKIYVQNFGQVELVFPADIKPYKPFVPHNHEVNPTGVENSKHNSCCLQKAWDDEPIFIILGRDINGPKTVMNWIMNSMYTQPFNKLYDAMSVAEQMTKFFNENATSFDARKQGYANRRIPSDEDMTTSIANLVYKLKTDAEYSRGWIANIAVEFQDQFKKEAETNGAGQALDRIHEISNRAATCFINRFVEIPASSSGFRS